MANLYRYNAQYEFKQSNWFKIDIVKGNDGEDAVTGNISGVEDVSDIMFYVQTASLPEISFDSTEAHVANRVYKSAGKPSFDDSTLEFTDSLDDEVANYFYEWQKEIFDPADGRMGRKTHYARTIYVEELNPEGDIINVWKFRGCWPSSVNYGDNLDYTQGERRELSVTITYDFASVVESNGKFSLAGSRRTDPANRVGGN